MIINSILENLKNAVALAERNSSRNQNLPILNCVFLEAENSKMVLRATNLETALEVSIPAKVEENGSIAVSARVLNSFLANVKGEQVTLENKKDNLVVKTNNTQTTIRGYSKDEFPLFPKISSEISFKMPAYELNSAIDNVVPAASLSDLKPELASLFIKMSKNTLKIVATDSFRLAEKNILSKAISFSDAASFLIPSRAASEIPRIFKNDQEVTISFNKNQISIKGDSVKFITRLVEGVFPDYEQIIPKTFKTEAVAGKEELLHQIKMASVFVGKTNDILLSFFPNDGKIIFFVSNQDSGEHSSSLSGNVKGEEIELKFNWRYLYEGIAQLNSENVVISINNSQSPMMLKGKEDNSYFYLAMPMKTV